MLQNKFMPKTVLFLIVFHSLSAQRQNILFWFANPTVKSESRPEWLI